VYFIVGGDIKAIYMRSFGVVWYNAVGIHEEASTLHESATMLHYTYIVYLAI